MALVLVGVVSTVWMKPLMGLTYQLINLLLAPLAMLVN
jgi:hypothetical protein